MYLFEEVMRYLPSSIFFFSMRKKNDWPITQKNETMEPPQNRRFYFEV
jgi:hypothetical protein